MNEPARPNDRASRAIFLVRATTAMALTFFLAVPFSQAADAWQGAQQQVAEAAADAQSPPDAPAPAADLQQENSSQSALPAEQSSSAGSPPQQQQGTPPTLGTAAAPIENPVGVAASKPAGAAIAPAKQRRTRSFAVRWAILIGAVAGVGTVIALSNASPSRPH